MDKDISGEAGTVILSVEGVRKKSAGNGSLMMLPST